jgi:hypothetical protein
MLPQNKSALPPANLTLWVYEKESNSLIFNEYSLSTVIAGLIKEETSQHNSRARMGGFDRSAESGVGNGFRRS